MKVHPSNACSSQCRPYDDPWLITAQLLTIASIFFGWLYWVTFVISLVGLAIFQVLWCARMNRGALYSQVAIALITSVGHLIVAIYYLVVGRDRFLCDPFIMWFDDDDDFSLRDISGSTLAPTTSGTLISTPTFLNDDYYASIDDAYWKWPNRDYCNEKTWFVIGLVCTLLWAAASACMFWFVKSGRHAKWEEKYTPTEGDVEITNQEAPVVADAAFVGETGKEDVVTEGDLEIQAAPVTAAVVGETKKVDTV